MMHGKILWLWLCCETGKGHGPVSFFKAKLYRLADVHSTLVMLQHRGCVQAVQHLSESPMSPMWWDLQLSGNTIFSFFQLKTSETIRAVSQPNRARFLPSIQLLYHKMAVSYHTHSSFSYSEGGKAEKRQKIFLFDFDVFVEMFPSFHLILNSANYYGTQN